jgi:hypothetical protein
MLERRSNMERTFIQSNEIGEKNHPCYIYREHNTTDYSIDKKYVYML